MGCVVDADNACPPGFDCLATGNGGACWPSQGDGGGCCDSGNAGAPTMLFGIGFVALFVRRRRRVA
jgi:MYXO-CTERM domain-containing protein